MTDIWKRASTEPTTAYITIIANKAELATFQAKEPQGYVFMNGDQGIGLAGELAEQARSVSGEALVKFARDLLPAALQACEARYPREECLNLK